MIRYRPCDPTNTYQSRARVTDVSQRQHRNLCLYRQPISRPVTGFGISGSAYPHQSRRLLGRHIRPARRAPADSTDGRIARHSRPAVAHVHADDDFMGIN